MYSGGPQRSLLNLISVINSNKYSIELLLFRRGGILYNEIPSFVKVSFVKPQGLYCRFRDSKFKFILFLPLRGIIKCIIALIPVSDQRKQEFLWIANSFFTRKNKQHFDMAIAYIEGFCIKYLSKKIRSSIKVGRIPTDYKSAKLNKNIDIKYFKKMNYLFAVSDENKRILGDVFPSLKDRIVVFQSIISPEVIKKMSLVGVNFKDEYKGIRILTMARYCLSKGIDLAIETCYLLIKEGYNIRWYFLGSGRSELFMNKIKELGITNDFVLIKEVSNPYAYLQQADIYVQPSKYEGKSNSINEAKAMSKQIIITNFLTAKDHLINMKEGIIAEMNAESIADAIKSLINQPKLGSSFSLNLSRSFKGNESEIEKLYQLLR